MNRLIIIILLLFPLSLSGQPSFSNDSEYYSGLKERQGRIISDLAIQTWEEGMDYRQRIYLGIVKVFSGIDEITGLQYLEDAVADSVHWGYFDLYSFMEAIYRLENKLPMELIARAKRRIADNFKKDKGFTDRKSVV